MTDRQSTHSQDCWDWGPRHYECAVREIKALRAEVANWKRVASAQAELHDESESRAERAEAALAELRAERDALAAALEAAREDAEARVAELEAENARLRDEAAPSDDWSRALRLADDAAESVIFTEGHNIEGRQWVLYPEQIAADPYLERCIAHLEWRGMAKAAREDGRVTVIFEEQT